MKLTPLVASSRARVFDRPIRPALQAAYTASPEEPTRAASEAMLMTLPPPASSIFGSTTWCMFRAPVRLMAISCSQCCGSVLRKGRKRSKPALLTSTVGVPSSCSMAATVVSMAT
ncbi:hypothetical protein FQZ97_982840 [compost metagenome]